MDESTSYMDYMEEQRKLYEDYQHDEFTMPFEGYRKYVVFTYAGFNLVGFLVNGWVLHVIAPLLCSNLAKVPRSILFYILALCLSDLVTMIGMLLLIIELVYGTWRFSGFACTAYLTFDGINKFAAPIIVFQISRACYSTVCLEKKHADRAASLGYAVVRTFIALLCVVVLLSPVFRYSHVVTFYSGADNVTKRVTVIHKCSFLPPPQIQVAFNVVACIVSYAIPLCGIVFWYASVPVFLRRRALTTLVNTNSMEAAIGKVIRTVVVLTSIYLISWSPYWLFMFAHQLLSNVAIPQRVVLIVSYFIHLLPYVSCSAYPVIFTLINRGIKSAHARRSAHQKRRARSSLNTNPSSVIRHAVSTVLGSSAAFVSSGGASRTVGGASPKCADRRKDSESGQRNSTNRVGGKNQQSLLQKHHLQRNSVDLVADEWSSCSSTTAAVNAIMSGRVADVRAASPAVEELDRRTPSEVREGDTLL